MEMKQAERLIDIGIFIVLAMLIFVKLYKTLNMKKTLSVYDNNLNRHKFEFDQIEDLREKLKEFNISLGIGVSIGYGTSIGDGTSIGYGTSIGDGTSIGYGTSIGSRTSIGNETFIGSRASIGNETSIGDETSIGSRTSIGNETFIGSRTSIGDGTSIGDNEKIIFSIYISGSKHHVNWWGKNIIQIGCMSHTIEEWKQMYGEIGKSEKYTDSEISEYFRYITICETMQKQIDNEQNVYNRT